jgi:hypothetical protein
MAQISGCFGDPRGGPVMNCLIVFSILGMDFSVLLKNGWSEQLKTIRRPNEFGTTKCGEKQ